MTSCSLYWTAVVYKGKNLSLWERNWHVTDRSPAGIGCGFWGLWGWWTVATDLPLKGGRQDSLKQGKDTAIVALVTSYFMLISSKCLFSFFFPLCCLLLKANLASSSSSKEWFSGIEMASLLSKKPCKEVKTTGILLLKENLDVQDKKRATVHVTFLAFPLFWLLRQMRVWVYCFTYLFVCLCCSMYSSCSFWTLPLRLLLLRYLAILDQISPDSQLLSKHQWISGSSLIEHICSSAKPVLKTCENFLWTESTQEVFLPGGKNSCSANK